MRQEAINSFDGGLNLDLNPITTPNNVLTDCLNGTFLTFNGDEMILQNDAGNTTILHNNLPVTLDQGFYPLGVKEYGGVLYIVSAKKPVDNAVLFSGGPYTKGTVVYSLVTGNKIYFYSKSDYNTQPLPIETNEYWEVVGDIYNYNNRFGLIQFGSYPSPIFGASSSNNGVVSPVTSTSISSYLYSPKILNTYEFKSGRYSMFNLSTQTTTSYISTYDTPKVYKVKLWHQLNNGFLDLTTSVWESYKTFTGSTSGFWFDHDTFKYYCPNLYKGKLAMSVEIEDIPTFQLASIPTLEYDVVNEEYTFKSKVTAIGNGYLTVPQTKIDLVFREIDSSNTYTASLTSYVINNIAEISYTFPKTYSGWILEYTWSPIVFCNLMDITKDLKAVQDYWKNQIILGKRVITTLVDDVKFILGKGYCLTPLPTQAHSEVILKNKNGDLLDASLEVTTTPHVFLEVGTTASTTSNVIAYYNIVNSKPVINYSYPTMVISDTILTSFEKFTVTSSKISCGFVDVTIELNIPLLGSYVKLTQNGIDYLGDGYSNSFVFSGVIHPEIPFDVTITSPTGTVDYSAFYPGDIFTRRAFWDISGTNIIVNNTIGVTFTYALVADPLFARIYYNNLYTYLPIWMYMEEISPIFYSIESTVSGLLSKTADLWPYYGKFIGDTNYSEPSQPSTSISLSFTGNLLDTSNTIYRNLLSSTTNYVINTRNGYDYIFVEYEDIPWNSDRMLIVQN